MVLGRIAPDLFFGGGLELDVVAARKALATLGRRPEQAAAAVIDVVDANMERALRVVSVERGHDPEAFTLIPFGGAGPLHACALADRMHIRSILVPRWPGLFSALGMLFADEVRERSRTALGLDVDAVFRGLGKGERFVDARYRGQSYEIRTPWRGHARAFHALHAKRYGFSRDEDPEIVNAIVRSMVARPKPRIQPIPRGSAKPLRRGVYDRATLGAGAKLSGPCIVMEDNATTWIAAGWRGVVDQVGNLRLWR